MPSRAINGVEIDARVRTYHLSTGPSVLFLGPRVP